MKPIDEKQDVQDPNGGIEKGKNLFRIFMNTVS